MPKVSVIVPIYNVERYVERCVRSLLEQTMQDMEFIFVDDCTPDKSVSIIKDVVIDYPERQAQVQFVRHTQNSGSATVRNSGLKKATGEYVIFCDSDDWVEKDMYRTMYEKAFETGADVVVSDFISDFGCRSSVSVQCCPNDNVECVRRMLSGKLHCSTWNKLIRRKLYLENDIHFPDGINMWEDVLTMIPIFYYSCNIVHVHQAYYHYVQYNEDSYTKSMKYSSLLNEIQAVDYLSSFFNIRNDYRFNREFCFTKLTVKQNLLLHCPHEKQAEFNKMFPEANKYILSYSTMSIYWRIALLFASCDMLCIFNIMKSFSKKLKQFLIQK